MKSNDIATLNTVLNKALWLVLGSVSLCLFLALGYTFYHKAPHRAGDPIASPQSTKAQEWRPTTMFPDKTNHDNLSPPQPSPPFMPPTPKKKLTHKTSWPDNKARILLFKWQCQGNIAYWFKRYVSALEYYKKSLVQAQKLLKKIKDTTKNPAYEQKKAIFLKKIETIYLQADELEKKGDQKVAQNNFRKALHYYQASLVIKQEALATNKDKERAYQEKIAPLLFKIINLYAHKGKKYAKALPLLERLLTIYAQDIVDHQKKRTHILRIKAFCQQSLRDYEAACDSHAKRIAIFKELEKKAKKEKKEKWNKEITKTLGYQADCCAKLNKKEAIDLYKQCVHIFETLEQATYSEDEIIFKNIAKIYYYHLKEYKKVVSLLEIFLNIYEKKHNAYKQDDTKILSLEQDHAEMLYLQGCAQKELKQYNVAVDSFRNSRAMYEKLLEKTAQKKHRSIYKKNIAKTCQEEGACYKLLQTPRKALTAYQKAIQYQSQIHTRSDKKLEIYVKDFIYTLAQINDITADVDKAVSAVLEYVKKHLGKNSSFFIELQTLYRNKEAQKE